MKNLSSVLGTCIHRVASSPPLCYPELQSLQIKAKFYLVKETQGGKGIGAGSPTQAAHGRTQDREGMIFSEHHCVGGWTGHQVACDVRTVTVQPWLFLGGGGQRQGSACGHCQEPPEPTRQMALLSKGLLYTSSGGGGTEPGPWGPSRGEQGCHVE